MFAYQVRDYLKWVMKSGWTPRIVHREYWFESVLNDYGLITKGQNFYCDPSPPLVENSDLRPEELRLPYPITNIFTKMESGISISIICKEIGEDPEYIAKMQEREPEFAPYFAASIITGVKSAPGGYVISPQFCMMGEKDGVAWVETLTHLHSSDTGDGRERWEKYSIWEEVDAINQLSRLAHKIVCGFLTQLHCSNVVEVIRQPNPKVNKKRKKKGKLPILQHKVLRIRLKNGQFVPLDVAEGDRNSPRYHSVRGFYKRQWSGSKCNGTWDWNRIWISPYMRGSKDLGTIEKDYFMGDNK